MSVFGFMMLFNTEYLLANGSGSTESEKLASMQQSVTVTGTVVNEAGEPLVGTNVVIKGTSRGTTTDMNGEYSIEVDSEEAVLQFLYIGYESQEVEVGTQRTINVTMESSMGLLDEFVVVAYGVQKRETLTGSISTIQGDNLKTTTSPSIAQSLQGKVAGVQIRQQNGQPGSFSSMVQIRGMGSPLYVIDGVVRDAGDGSGEFQRLNPEDIESISILKDGSAALYGMNAANGVVIVTTKTGTKGRTQFSYTGQGTVLNPTSMLQVMDAAQHLEIKNEMSMNAGTGSGTTEEELENWRLGSAGYESTDWVGNAFKNRAITTNHTLSAQGGSDNLTYYTSFGYENQGDLTSSGNFNYSKYTMRARLVADIIDNLELDLNVSGRYDVTESPNKGIHNLLFQTTMTEPTNSIYANNNPEFYSISNPFSDNPIAGMDVDETGLNQRTGRSILSSATFTYSVPWVEGLRVRLKGAYDAKDSRSVNEKITYVLYAYDDVNEEIHSVITKNEPTTLFSHMDVNNNQNIQTSIMYETSIDDKHNISVQALHEMNRTRYDYVWGEREYQIYAKPVLDLGSAENIRNSGGYGESTNISYLSRLNYNYDEKYLIEGGFRYNGSYRYAPEHRWGFFPVLSAGWRISEEPFIKNNLNFLSEFKLRSSYGKTGVDAGDEFQHIPGYTLGGIGYEFVDGVQTGGVNTPPIMNRGLTWIESTTFDVGFDMEIYDGLFGLTVDFYQRDRTGLLATSITQITNTFGASLPQENLNADMTQGVEFTVTHRNRIGDLLYNVQGNLNYSRSMLTEQVRGEYSSSMNRWRHGHEGRWQGIGWGHEIDGQYQSREEIYNETVVQTGGSGNTQIYPGDFYLEDVNGDGYITGDDSVPMFYGLNMPALNFGFSIGGSWKQFDFYTLLQGSAGYSIQIPDNVRIAGPWNGNSAEYLYDRWHREDPFDINSEWIPGKNPSARSANLNPPANGAQNTNRNTVDGSYLRLKSLELGYTLPARISSFALLENARFFVNGYNLFTFFDPFLKDEVNVDPEKSEGWDGRMLNYPLSKSITFGANINF